MNLIRAGWIGTLFFFYFLSEAGAYPAKLERKFQFRFSETRFSNTLDSNSGILLSTKAKAILEDDPVLTMFSMSGQDVIKSERLQASPEKVSGRTDCGANCFSSLQLVREGETPYIKLKRILRDSPQDGDFPKLKGKLEAKFIPGNWKDYEQGKPVALELTANGRAVYEQLLYQQFSILFEDISRQTSIEKDFPQLNGAVCHGARIHSIRVDSEASFHGNRDSITGPPFRVEVSLTQDLEILGN